MVRFIANFAFAAAGENGPFAVTLAQIRWRLNRFCIFHTNARLLFDDGNLTAGWRFIEMCKILGDRRTCDVIHFDCQHTDASTLIAECKVDTFLGDGNTFHFRIDVHIRVLIESSFTGRNSS